MTMQILTDKAVTLNVKLGIVSLMLIKPDNKTEYSKMFNKIPTAVLQFVFANVMFHNVGTWLLLSCELSALFLKECPINADVTSC